ncbi:helix-turn-helix domain-containing protein [Lentzea sp. NBRC 102530]|uniref:helix-turn-helix domain-containing protein n=1 Tax=Lentzea sp. NBRC 102530 TaxID=3032201 RepID=UPI0024A0C208|nr:helix-turn-helix domain-containing protein [Lentzea sp. NBRC 102530]GLY55339.1 hypothetical protein Lesp01_89940 [Lentzea sp. NBRC 102530]
MPRRKYPDYDWVVVQRFWSGRKVDRKLVLAEKAEIVRLILRHNLGVPAAAQRMGMSADALERWMRTHKPAALQTGLSDPLRFQFIPDHLIPSDAWLKH